MKYYSFFQESVTTITKEKESHILNNTVYHSSHIQMPIIKGKETKNAKDRFGYGVVFVSPYKYVSSLFIIDQFLIRDLICQKYPNIKKENISKFSYFTDSMKKKLSTLSEKELQTTYPKYFIVDTKLIDKDNKIIKFKDFNYMFTGYIHHIDYNEYKDKDKAFQDHNHPFEFAIKGNVKPFKIEKIQIKFLVRCYNG